MVFYIFTFIVFIAELIIAFSAIMYFYRINKKLQEYNELLDLLKPKIKDIMDIVKKISKQLVALAPIAVEKIKSFITQIVIDQVKNLLAGLTFWAAKNIVEKHTAK